jgi:hypothetical protein
MDAAAPDAAAPDAGPTPSDASGGDPGALPDAATAADAASDTAGADGATADVADAAADATSPDAGTDPAAAMNAGWIGGACAADADCPYAGGFCLPAAQGLPAGMCSQACATSCPDAPGAVTTFCVDPAAMGLTGAGGLCGMRCWYTPDSPTGCRPGYQCVATERHTEPATIAWTCVPGDDQPFELGACHESLLAAGVGFEPAPNPLAHPASNPELLCDVQDPVRIEGTLHGIPFRPGTLSAEPKRLFASCGLALGLSQTALHLASVGCTDLVQWGIYNCRVISGTNTLSQHGLANGIDFAAFRLAGGAVYTVLTDWEIDTPSPLTAAGQWLKALAVHLASEGIFTVVLTPDYNAAHADHFHCDLTP